MLGPVDLTSTQPLVAAAMSAKGTDACMTSIVGESARPIPAAMTVTITS